MEFSASHPEAYLEKSTLFTDTNTTNITVNENVLKFQI